ncbi:MAG TPA: hypothetical protein VFQ45_01755 [Longimicrobium sp.]|nr:hypothetical protein [Longimicrobium sp.]
MSARRASDTASMAPAVTTTSSAPTGARLASARRAISRRSSSAPLGMEIMALRTLSRRATAPSSRARRAVGSSAGSGSAVPSATSAGSATASRKRTIRSPVVTLAGASSTRGARGRVRSSPALASTK